MPYAIPIYGGMYKAPHRHQTKSKTAWLLYRNQAVFSSNAGGEGEIDKFNLI